MVMFKTQDPRLRIARGRKQVVRDRATSRAGSYHQSRMIVGWQVALLVWRLTERPCDWSCYLWNSYTTGSTIYYDQWQLVARPYNGRATSRQLIFQINICCGQSHWPMWVRQVAGNVWKYDKKDHVVRHPRVQIEKWQPNCHTMKDSHQMFTANMQSFTLNIIYTGSQII